MSEPLHLPVRTPTPHPSSSYSATMRVRLDDKPGMFARLAAVIDEAGGLLGATDLVRVDAHSKVRDLTVLTAGERHLHEIAEKVKAIDSIEIVASPTAPSCCTSVARSRCARRRRSRRATTSRWPTRRASRGSAWRSPRTRRKAGTLTIKHNTVAVVSDGTAVLGLGDIGPEAAMPVMEGKAMLFKEFGGVDALPICLDTKDTDEIVEAVQVRSRRLRRHQPRGHHRAALLRDRGAAAAPSSTSRSSTTTSTARRSSCWRRCMNALKIVEQEDGGHARSS